MSTTDTNDTWHPLSARESEEGIEAYDALHAGVPPWLRDSLWEWIEPKVSWFKPTGYAPGDGYRIVDGDLLRQLERVLRFDTGWSGRDPMDGLHNLRDKVKSEPKLMLDVADYLVGHAPQNHPGMSPEELDKRLEESGSAYKVDILAQPPALVRRVDATVEAAAKRIMEQQAAPNLLAQLGVCGGVYT